MHLSCWAKVPAVGGEEVQLSSRDVQLCLLPPFLPRSTGMVAKSRLLSAVLSKLDRRSQQASACCRPRRADEGRNGLALLGHMEPQRVRGGTVPLAPVGNALDHTCLRAGG